MSTNLIWFYLHTTSSPIFLKISEYSHELFVVKYASLTNNIQVCYLCQSIPPLSASKEFVLSRFNVCRTRIPAKLCARPEFLQCKTNIATVAGPNYDVVLQD